MNAKLDRVPPNDLDAEAVVIASAIIDPRIVADLREVLNADDFYSDANRRIFDALAELDETGSNIDEVAVLSLLRTRGQLERTGGASYLAQLVMGTPATLHAKQHAEVIREKARQRRTIALCQRFAAEGYGDVGAVGDWLQRLERAVYELGESSAVDAVETFAEAVPKTIAEVQELRAGGAAPFVATGYTDLDRKLGGGLRRSKQYVVAGRPGMGKSAMALNLALNVADTNQAAVVISCEMSRAELVSRAVAVRGNLDVAGLLAGDMSDATWALALEAAEDLRHKPVALRYCPAATISAIRSTVRSAMRQLKTRGFTGGLGLIVVDYLQIMAGDRRGGDTRDNEISDLTKRLVWLAGEFDAPVITVSQLNRGVETRDKKDKRPRLADLRESGAIEQDAYAVVLLYRDEYYDNNTRQKGVLEAIVAKNRNGSCGTVPLSFTGDSTRVANLATSTEWDGEWYNQ